MLNLLDQHAVGLRQHLGRFKPVRHSRFGVGCRIRPEGLELETPCDRLSELVDIVTPQCRDFALFAFRERILEPFRGLPAPDNGELEVQAFGRCLRVSVIRLDEKLLRGRLALVVQRG